MFWATKKIPSQISARGGQPHYLNAGEKAFFARLPSWFKPEDYQLAQEVYAGILSAWEPDFAPKYLAGEEEWRIELNDLVVFARTWRQTPVGRAIHQMFEIPGYGNYCELAYQLFLLRMEAVDLAEKDKLLAEELAEMRKKENDIKREVEVAEETFVEMLLRGELKEIAELKKEVHSRLNARYCENESGCSQKVSQREKYCFFHNKSCPAVACRERMSNSWNHCTYHRLCLEKVKNVIGENIKALETFSTWFNENCGWVISQENSIFYLWIVIYEPPCHNMRENMVKIKDKTHFSSLPAAKNRAVAVKEKLKSENPILALYNSNKSYSIAEEIIHPPHILKFKLPRDKNENYPNNPDDHIKPLDIVWIEKEKLDVRFFHVGVYLGNNKVCHVTGSPFNGREGTKITGWKKFLEGGVGDLIRYHTIIPFKKYELIVKQIAWAEENKFREGLYCVANKNCEHLANMLIYGIEFSQQVKEREFKSKCAAWLGEPNRINNNKEDTIKLVDEIKESNDKLGKSSETSYWYKEIKARIEIPPKQDCRVM